MPGWRDRRPENIGAIHTPDDTKSRWKIYLIGALSISFVFNIVFFLSFLGFNALNTELHTENVRIGAENTRLQERLERFLNDAKRKEGELQAIKERLHRRESELEMLLEKSNNSNN